MTNFAFDLGTNSIGFAVLDRSGPDSADINILNAGVRIFRTASSGRHRSPTRERAAWKSVQGLRRRRLGRSRSLVRELAAAGLLPEARPDRDTLFAEDPYSLRALGLDSPLTPHQIGRAVFHLHRRRGAPGGSEQPPAGFRTSGEYLWARHEGPVRKRHPTRDRKGLGDGGNRPPCRAAIRAEFDLLWESQRRFHNDLLNPALKARIVAIIFGGNLDRHGACISKSAAPWPVLSQPISRNPAVSVVVNQFRRMLRKLIAAHGEPERIAIEAAHRSPDILPEADGQTATGETRRHFTQALKALGKPATRSNLLRLKLFERQRSAAGGETFCPYRGTAIPLLTALSQSVEIDHVLPLSAGGDDTHGNLLLCLAEANRAKGARSPHDAFGHEPFWPEIVSRLPRLPASVRPRFAPGAASLASRDFDARQAHDMRQIVRQAVRLCGATCRGSTVHLVPAHAVASLRSAWQKETASAVKNRHDHRHHAIDAIAAGILAPRQDADRIGEAKCCAPASATSLHSQLGKAVRAAIAEITVSLRPERGRTGRQHKETIHGVVGGVDGTPRRVTYRKPLLALSHSEIRAIRDDCLRQELMGLCGDRADAPSLRKALAAFSRQGGIRRARLVRPASGGILIDNLASGRHVLLPAGNCFMDIVALRDGSWKAFGATIHDVGRSDWRPEWEKIRCGGKLVMRLHKGDMIELTGADGIRSIKTVMRLSPSSGYLHLAGHNEAGDLSARHADTADAFRWELVRVSSLAARNARAVAVDELGRVSYRRSNVA